MAGKGSNFFTIIVSALFAIIGHFVISLACFHIIVIRKTEIMPRSCFNEIVSTSVWTEEFLVRLRWVHCLIRLVLDVFLWNRCFRRDRLSKLVNYPPLVEVGACDCPAVNGFRLLHLEPYGFYSIWLASHQGRLTSPRR